MSVKSHILVVLLIILFLIVIWNVAGYIFTTSLISYEKGKPMCETLADEQKADSFSYIPNRCSMTFCEIKGEYKYCTVKKVHFQRNR